MKNHDKKCEALRWRDNQLQMCYCRERALETELAETKARLAEAEAWLRSADLSLRDKDRALAIRIQHFLRPADSAAVQESESL